jgi:hypothetical protein
MNEKSDDLQKLISLSRAMLQQAQSASWDEVSKLEAIRRELINTFFLTPIKAELNRTVSEGISSIIAIDQDIMALGIAEKLELEQVLRQIEQGKKAVKAYSS